MERNSAKLSGGLCVIRYTRKARRHTAGEERMQQLESAEFYLIPFYIFLRVFGSTSTDNSALFHLPAYCMVNYVSVADDK